LVGGCGRERKRAIREWIEHSRAEGMDVPNPRTAEELLKNSEVVEDIEATGAVMREVQI
jgi:hypothetical protein